MITINTITRTLALKYNMTFSGRLLNREIVIRCSQGQSMPHELLSIIVDVTGTDITNHTIDNISLPRSVWTRIIDRVNYVEPLPEVNTMPNTTEDRIIEAVESIATTAMTSTPVAEATSSDNLNTQSQTPPVEAESDEAEETNTFVCHDCESEYDLDEVHEIENIQVCDGCYDNYSTCDACSQEFNRDSEYDYVSLDYNTYCGNCADDNTWTCDSCETTYDGDEYSSHDGNTYCDSCFNDRFDTCSSCDETYSNDDSYFCEDCSSSYCQGCWDEHEHNEDSMTPEQREERDRARREAQERAIAESAMRNPWRKPSEEFYRGNPEVPTRFIKVDRFVGVEIEAEKGDTYGLGIEVPKEVGISTDGSLHDRGVELQTPPSSLDKLEDFVTKTCEALQAKGYKGTKSAGLHIHIDARDIRNDHAKLTQVIKTFYAVEDMLYSMLPPSRWASNYCKRLSQSYLYNNFRTKADVKDLQKEWYKEEQDDRLERHTGSKYDNARYYGLNIHSVFFRGTIELRYHSGTVNPTKILQWANLTLRIMDWALKNYDEKLVEQLFNMETSHDKYRLFKGMLNMPYELESYVNKRIQKFNPSFVVKFNKGKKVRAIERRKINAYNKKVEEYRITCENKKYEQLKKDWERRVEQDRDYSMPTEEQLRREAQQMAREVMQYDMPMSLQQARPQVADGGFIEDTEIRTIQTFMEQGRQLQNDNNIGGEVDIEE